MKLMSYVLRERHEEVVALQQNAQDLRNLLDELREQLDILSAQKFETDRENRRLRDALRNAALANHAIRHRANWEDCHMYDCIKWKDMLNGKWA